MDSARKKKTTTEVTETSHLEVTTVYKKRDNDRQKIEKMNAELKRQADTIASLKEQLEQQSDMDNSAILLEASNHISQQEARVYRHTIKELRLEVEDLKKTSAAIKKQLDLERLRCESQDRELNRRKEQLREATESITAMREQLKKASESGIQPSTSESESLSSWAAREHRLRQEWQERSITYQTQIAALETKLSMFQRRRELNTAQATLRHAEQTHQEEVTELNDMLKKCQSRLGEAIADSSKRERTTIEKSAELATLRARLEVSTPLRGIRRTESMEDILLNQVKALTAQIEQMKSPLRTIGNQDQHQREYVEGLQQKVGSLTATNAFLEQQMQSMVTREQNLTRDLSNATDEMRTLKSDLDRLQKKMAECGNDAELTHKFLVEETSKIKQQKAQLRCDFLELKRQNARLQTDLEKCQKSEGSTQVVEERINKAVLACESAADEKTGLCAQLDLMKAELEAAKRESAESRKEFDSLQKTTSDQRVIDQAMIRQMKSELLVSGERYVKLQQAAELLDRQCEQLEERVKAAEAGRAKAMEKAAQLAAELETLRRERDAQRTEHADLEELSKDRDRLQKKCDYLLEELRETHTDYREELVRLARQMSESKQRDASENESFSAKVQELQSKLRQQETTERSLQRQLQQTAQERDGNSKHLAELRFEQSKLLDENAKLRRGIEEALRKIETYKEDADSIRALNQHMAADITENHEKMTTLESKLGDCKEQLAEKEHLISYLQSQVELKRTQKIRVSTSQSTLISSSISDPDLPKLIPLDKLENANALADLEQQREILFHELVIKKEVLAKKRSRDESEPAVPLLRYPNNGNSTPMAPGMRTPLSDRNSDGRSTEALTVSGMATPIPGNRNLGTMRHDIPHRWKTYMVLKQVKCAVCMDGLPRVKYGLKCVECGVIIHKRCSPLIAHTCGLPVQCADFYLEAQTMQKSIGGGATAGMSGWVKIWRSDTPPPARWRSAWAHMTQQGLKFYDNENLASNDGSAFLSVDLDKDSWRMVQQMSVDEEGVKACGPETISRMLELRLTGFRLFMIAPTMPARQRWVEALLSATDRRMFIQRRSSVVQPILSTLMLGLDAPHNLSINCSLVVGDWLLLGCQEGLFITQMASMHLPFNIAGFSGISQMEQCAAAEMVLLITGAQRSLALLHMRQLREALGSKHPAIQSTPVPGMQNCHRLMVHEDNHDKKSSGKYLCVADQESIHVLQYNSRLAVFTPYKNISTNEPTICMMSTPNGFIFGADGFYSVDFDQMIARPMVVPDCGHDFPVDAIRISTNEILLAFLNYGIFVDLNCKRTRNGLVEWERNPLEFVCTGPYLYVTHFDTLEILQIAPYESENTVAFLDESEMYRCSGAHHIGFGRMDGDVLFALSRRDRIEVHQFNAFAITKEKKNSSLKRKPQVYLEALQHLSQPSSDKRTKK